MTEHTFLSDEWLDALEAALAPLPAQPGVDGSLLFVVTGSPDGRVQFRIAFEDGRVSEIEFGKAETDTTITWKYAEAVAVFSGDRDLDVAFMQGRTKVEGDYARYLVGLRPVINGEPFQAAIHELAAATAF